MKTKSAGILASIGGILLLGLPVVYQKYGVSNDIQNQILAFAMGNITALTAHKVHSVRKEKAKAVEDAKPQ